MKKKTEHFKTKGHTNCESWITWTVLKWSSCNRTTIDAVQRLIKYLTVRPFPGLLKVNNKTAFYLTWKGPKKRIKISFDDQCKQVVSFFRRGVCSKRNRIHVIRVSIELKKHLKSLGELEKAMETLVYRLVFPQKFSFSVISIKDMFSFSQVFFNPMTN